MNDFTYNFDEGRLNLVVGHECETDVFDDATFAVLINDEDVSLFQDNVGDETIELTYDISSDVLFSCPHTDNEDNFYNIECPVLF